MIVQIFQISAESHDARTDYLAHTFCNSPQSAEAAARWATAADTLTEPPVLADQSEWPALSSEQMAAVQNRMSIGSDLADRSLTLNDGEVVEEDCFSYLMQPWGEIPAATPVLRRTTNLSGPQTSSMSRRSE